MGKEKELQLEEHRFIDYLIKGFSRKDAYRKAYDDYKSSDSDIIIKANGIYNKGTVNKKIHELCDVIHNEVIEKGIWSREESVYELKELLRKNKIESDRYEKAYNDEMDLLNGKIEKKEKEIYSPDSYLTKSKELELRGELESLKFAKIQCNRRKQSNKALNEAILFSIQQLNEMYGYNKKSDDALKIDAQIIFKDDIGEDD